ncbi:MAG: hypothetical protein AAF802_02570 [Planctomycetota bacterium]
MISKTREGSMMPVFCSPNRGNRSQLTAIFTLAFLTVASWSQADEPTIEWKEGPDSESTPGETEVLRRIDFRSPVGEPCFKLTSPPILTWGRKGDVGSSGTLWLWLEEGLPSVAVCQYEDQGNGATLEFQSLISETNFRLIDRDIPLWSPSEPGIEMSEVPQATGLNGERTDTAEQRLNIMRKIASRFDAALTPPRKPEIKLERVTKEVFRFEPTKDTAQHVDGAIFVFTREGDPDLLLIIKADKPDGGELRWQYGAARMSMVPMKLLCDGKRVWSKPWGQPKNPSSDYFSHRIESPDDVKITVFPKPR